jgi:hypothetical protein
MTFLRRLDDAGIPVLTGNKSYNFRSYSRRKMQMIFCTGMKEMQKRDAGLVGGEGVVGGGRAVLEWNNPVTLPAGISVEGTDMK